MLNWTREPDPSLAHLVRCFHALEDLHVPTTSEHRLYPEHTLSLSFLDGTSWFATDPSGAPRSLTPISPVFVDNPTTQPVRVVSLGRTRMVGINFYVWGAIRLFGRLPSNDEVGSFVPARIATSIAQLLARGARHCNDEGHDQPRQQTASQTLPAVCCDRHINES